MDAGHLRVFLEPEGGLLVSSRNRDGTEAELLPLHKEDRLAEHRRSRRVSRQVLHVEGEEAVLSDVPAHLHAHRSEKPVDPLKASRARRHWKLPFWKRRGMERHNKNESLRSLAMD